MQTNERPPIGKGWPPIGKGKWQPPIGKGAMPMGKGKGNFGPGPPGGPGLSGPAGVMPPPPVPANRKTQLCVYFKEGRCTRGTSCNYAHGEHELVERERGVPSRPPPPPREVRHPTGSRFDVRSGPQVHRGPRDMRPPSRERSQRQLRKVVYAKSETVGVVERPDCSVRQTTEATEQAADLPEPNLANGSAPKVAEEGGEAQESTAPENGDSLPKEAEGIDVDVEAEAEAKEQEPPKGAPAPAPAPVVASFLLSEDGAGELSQMYGLGAQLLRSMGWQPGSGVGANLDGELEPVSIRILSLPSTHFGRKDRRCLGRRKPKRLRDSDESSPSRTPSTSSSRSTSKSSQKSSRSSSPSSRKKRRRRRKKRKKSRSSSSRRSSASSSSSSSKSHRKKKKGKFTSEAPTDNSGGAAAAGAAAGANAAGAQQAAVEDPETAQAKKRVLAKLTELQKVEPKEQRAKEFRNLLRDWHPDKNPEKKDMATAVFQFLQKGKSLLNLK
ncbi:unnamed protein product [Symbiodinium pilosum]|uniref:Zinc finger CCCH domain-containing protein 18 n=1 Tax=Symbiodinium pilosum TaxID=2952 RepID=A0A812RE69_SYMPI|nr:unnamed protein product [Symbiodinium pilosum]